MNEGLKPKDSRDELINYLSGSDSIGYVYGGCHVMNKRLKPEDSRDELINSLSGSDCLCLAYEAFTMNEQIQLEDLSDKR